MSKEISISIDNALETTGTVSLEFVNWVDEFDNLIVDENALEMGMMEYV